MPKVVVLIPTFDHGPTLLPAIHSVLRQTEADVVVHVVGDGAPASTDAMMAQIIESEPRVHYHANPKSPRTGEPYRHLLLQSVQCQFVAYLSDDDIWAPDHLERVTEPLARGADFVATLTLLLGDGDPELMRVDLSDPADRAMLLGSVNRVTLSAAAHRLDSYLRLPFGWRTTPAGEWTDHWMWKQWLAQEWVRAESVAALTALHTPKLYRGSMSVDEIAAANWKWCERTTHPSWPTDRDALLIAAANRSARRAEERHRELVATTARAVEVEAALSATLLGRVGDAAAAKTAAVSAQYALGEAIEENVRTRLERDQLLSSTIWRASRPARALGDRIRNTKRRSLKPYD